MKKIFITRKIPEIAIQKLSRHFQLDFNELNEKLDRDKLKDIFLKYDGVLTTILDKIDEEILRDSVVKVISNYAIGLDNIDLDLANKMGISVYNTPDVVTESTADLTIAMLLSFIRKIQEANQFVKSGKWNSWDPEIFLGEELSNKTYGIIGMGRIGKAVAKRIKSFGLRVIFYDPSEERNEYFEKVDLEFLLCNSDYISIHIPLNKENHNFIDELKIDKMKKKPLILNLSRGKIVKTEAIISAIEQEKIRGVCLDVTEPEPLPRDHKLNSLKNCLITPHIGTATKECRFKMAEMAADNLINHFIK